MNAITKGHMIPMMGMGTELTLLESLLELETQDE